VLQNTICIRNGRAKQDGDFRRAGMYTAFSAIGAQHCAMAPPQCSMGSSGSPCRSSRESVLVLLERSSPAGRHILTVSRPRRSFIERRRCRVFLRLLHYYGGVTSARSAIRVVGEALVLGASRQALYGPLVQTRFFKIVSHSCQAWRAPSRRATDTATDSWIRDSERDFPGEHQTRHCS